MNGLPVIRTSIDNIQIEYEVILPYDMQENPTAISAAIHNALQNIDKQVEVCQERADQLNTEIDKLTNHADGLDYSIAVICGILTGLFDSFLVGEFDFAKGKEWSNKAVNDYIMRTAKRHGYTENRLVGAISKLEENTVDQDNIWKGKEFSSARSHHLDDLAHHPTPLGLICSVGVQFFRCGVFVDKKGKWHIVPIDTDPKQLIEIWAPIIFSGIVRWMLYLAESHLENQLDREIPAPLKKMINLIAGSPAIFQILKCVDNWALHLASDMAGSKNSPGGGMGIPGFFLSLFKEFSSLPLLKDTELPTIINDWYSKRKFDLRSELAVGHELGRQAIPVLINEMLVRGFYFIRRLADQFSTANDFCSVEWEKTLPFGNRTIVRMLTIATGTFTVVDMADAAIRSADKIAGGPVAFLSSFILRVNFVGLGRFAVAIQTDAVMEKRRQAMIQERLQINAERLLLLCAKVEYKVADVWDTAKTSVDLQQKLEIQAQNAITEYYRSLRDTEEDIDRLFAVLDSDPSLRQVLMSLLENGGDTVAQTQFEYDIGDFPKVISRQLTQINDIDRKIKATVESAEKARREADLAKQKYAGGRSAVAAVEALQYSHDMLAKAVTQLAETQKVLFDLQTRLSETTQVLFNLGLGNIARNRSVVRQLTEYLENKQTRKLGTLARQEFERLVNELKSQEDMLLLQENLSERVGKIEAILTEITRRYNNGERV